MRGQSGDAETRSNVHRRSVWQSHRLTARHDDELLCRAVCALPRRLPKPDALSDSAVRDAIADGVDRSCAILVGDELWKRKLGIGASPAARLPVGGIHARDVHLDSHFTRSRFAHGSLDEMEDLRPTRLGKHDRSHCHLVPGTVDVTEDAAREPRTVAHWFIAKEDGPVSRPVLFVKGLWAPSP